MEQEDDYGCILIIVRELRTRVTFRLAETSELVLNNICEVLIGESWSERSISIVEESACE